MYQTKNIWQKTFDNFFKISNLNFWNKNITNCFLKFVCHPKKFGWQNLEFQIPKKASTITIWYAYFSCWYPSKIGRDKSQPIYHILDIGYIYLLRDTFFYMGFWTDGEVFFWLLTQLFITFLFMLNFLKLKYWASKTVQNENYLYWRIF